MNLLASYAESSDGGIFTGLALAFIAVTTILAYVVTSAFTATFFTKIGEPQWKAWVPVYANWVFLERAGFAGAWSLLALGGIIPSVGFIPQIALVVFLVLAAIRYGEDFNRPGAGYAVLYAVVPVVWLGILGLSRDVYAPRADRRRSAAVAAAYTPAPYPDAQPPSKDSSPYGPPPTD